MKAIILAAGLGTRMKPLTDHIPKALVAFNGVPLLDGVISRLFKSGIEAIIVNIHHFPDQVIRFLHDKQYYGGRVVVSDETDQLLDTGGALIQAGWFLNDGNPFLVHNVDIYTNLNIRQLIEEHIRGNAMITIAVKERPTSRPLLFDKDLRLVGWKNNETGEEIIIHKDRQIMYAYGNSCIQVIQPEFF